MLIPTKTNTKTVSDLRKDPRGLIEAAAKISGPCYIFYRATPKAVILSIHEYIDLVKSQEDYYDSLEAKKLAKENKKKIKWLSQEEFEKAAGV